MALNIMSKKRSLSITLLAFILVLLALTRVAETKNHGKHDLELARVDRSLISDYHSIMTTKRLLDQHNDTNGEDHEHEDGEHEDGDREDGDHEDGDHEDGDHEDGDHEDGDHEGHDHSSTSSSSSELDDGDKPWGEVILAAFLVNLVTLSGVIFLVPAVQSAFRVGSCCSTFCWYLRKKPESASEQSPEQKRKQVMFSIVMSSFACGAILATAVFLIMPEAILLISSDGAVSHEGETEEEHAEHTEESGSIWKFGAALLGGFLMPVFLGALFPRAVEHECDEECHEGPHGEDSDYSNKTDGDAIPESECSSCVQDTDDIARMEDDVEIAVPADHDHDIDTDKIISESTEHTHQDKHVRQTQVINWRLCSSVLIGDFFHNFADGIFIGTAFLLCTRSVAITVVLTTVYHEIAQELADYFLLTNHGGLSPLQAFGINFLSGLSVMLGAIVVLAADPGPTAIGVILSISAGVYIHLSASECLPRVMAMLHTIRQRAVSLLAFVIGAVPIGLVLLNHSHCGDH